MRAAGLALICLIAAAAAGDARAACRDSYAHIMAGAAAEWPDAAPFQIGRAHV